MRSRKASGVLTGVTVAGLYALLAMVSAMAEEVRDPANPVLGVGAEPCSVFMSTFEHNPDSLKDHDHETGDEGPHHITPYTSPEYMQWIQGYLSAYNLHANDGRNLAGRASPAGMLYFLYRRCTAQPDEPLISVMPQLLERLQGQETGQ